MTNYKNDIQKIIPHIKERSNKTGEKAIIDMARSLVGALYEADITVDTFLNDFKKDQIFDASCYFENGANVFDYYKNVKYKELIKIMFQLRPVGLGTPNAMVGESEFLGLMTTVRSGVAKKKNTGDITVDDKTIELKGDKLRFMGKITGKNLQKHMMVVSKKYKVKPNETTKGRTAYEPWGRSGNKINHWLKEMNKLGASKGNKYLQESLSVVVKGKIDYKSAFVKGKFDVEELNKIMLINLFKSQTKLWDAFTVISDGVVSCITSCEKSFAKMVNTGKIKVTGDYFRSFQDMNVGLYCEFA